jgi:hypothetical protein
MTGTREPVPVREIIMPLTSLTLAAIQAEALRAHYRHAERSVLRKDMSNGERSVILVDAISEVVSTLVSDGDTANLETELIQVAAIAASWVEALNTR